MSNIASYACHLYVRAWDFSEPSLEGRSNVYQSEDEDFAKWVGCFKWAARAATLGVFSGGALCAAFTLGASAMTIQVLTASTALFFGVSAVSLLIPVMRRLFFGAVLGAGAGLFLLYQIREQVGFVAYLTIRSYAIPIIGFTTVLGMVAYPMIDSMSRELIINSVTRVYSRLQEDYQHYIETIEISSASEKFEKHVDSKGCSYS